MFSRSRSRRSSRSSSAQSLPEMNDSEQIPQNIDAIVNLGENVDLGAFQREPAGPRFDSPDSSVDQMSQQAQFTRNHPLGKILINIYSELCDLADKTKVKEMNNEMGELYTGFYNAMRLSKSNTRRQIKQATEELEQNLIENELNSHLVNDNSEPPKYFSDIPVLVTPQKRSEAMKTFPTRQRFSGNINRDNGSDILEFLSNMRTAQSYCNLSQDEFKEFLLLCTTGRAHALISEWIDLNEPIPTIFHNLIMHFDTRITPEHAKELLFNYKAPKDATLRDVEMNISQWASRAATLISKGPSRVAYYNMEYVQNLIRCLPPISSGMVQSTYTALSTRLKRAAYATELSRALNINRHVIDSDIRTNGGEPNKKQMHKKNSKGRNNKFQARNFSSFLASAQQSSDQNNNTLETPDLMNVQSLPPQVYVLSPQQVTHSGRAENKKNPQHRRNSNNNNNKNPNHAFRPNGMSNSNGTGNNPGRTHNSNIDNTQRLNQRRKNRNGRMHNKNQFGTKQNNYCSLCGKRDHLASQDCPYMVNDDGTHLMVMPTLGTCKVCPPSVNPRLNHPSQICPYRQGGPLYGSK